MPERHRTHDGHGRARTATPAAPAVGSWVRTVRAWARSWAARTCSADTPGSPGPPVVLSRREPPLPLEGVAVTSEKSASARAALVSATKGVKLGLVRVVQQGIVPLPARPEAAGQAQWRIARRSLSHLFELTYYRANGTAETALSVLVRVSGQRWVLEVGFEDAKDLIGPDQYEERKWTAWYRHITLPLRIHA